MARCSKGKLGLKTAKQVPSRRMQRAPKNLKNLHSVLGLAAVGEDALLTRHALLGAGDLGEADMARAEGWVSGPEQRQRD